MGLHLYLLEPPSHCDSAAAAASASSTAAPTSAAAQAHTLVSLHTSSLNVAGSAATARNDPKHMRREHVCICIAAAAGFAVAATAAITTAMRRRSYGGGVATPAAIRTVPAAICPNAITCRADSHAVVYTSF
eukprot:359517-Chlamydomonas_euryale.AAC.9